MGAVRSLSSWRRNGWEAKLTKWWTVDGLSGGQIAAKLGISRGAVLGKLHRMGLGGTRGGGKHQTNNQSKADNAKAARTKKSVTQTAWRRARGMALPVGDNITTISVLPSDPPAAERVTFEELKRHQCRWPFEDATYCARHRDGTHTSYCADHHARAYRPARTPDFPSRTRS